MLPAMVITCSLHGQVFLRELGFMKRVFVFVGLLLMVFCYPRLVAGDLTEERCSKLLAELQQGKEALWRTIPWKLSILEARATAFKQDKPIFIWAMDGHPLGCT